MTRLSYNLFLLLFFLVSGSVVAADLQWHPQDIQSAAAKAGTEGKLIYVFVEGDNCPPCEAFKASHLSDPAFIDFVNTIYVPIRVHMSDPNGKAFLDSLRLTHAAVPRFYVLTPDGKGVSMSVGMVVAPPMGAADVLKLATGKDLTVDKAKAAGLAARIRSHAASQKAAGVINPDNPLRYLGLAVLEAQAWALAGRLDEAESVFGAHWAEQLVDQDIRLWYVNFWLAWDRNLPGALQAARVYQSTTPQDPMGHVLMGRALAANGDSAGAVREGEALLAIDPNNQQIAQMVVQWRNGKR